MARCAGFLSRLGNAAMTHIVGCIGIAHQVKTSRAIIGVRDRRRVTVDARSTVGQAAWASDCNRVLPPFGTPPKLTATAEALQGPRFHPGTTFR
jgi:hypothetical protein